VALAGLAILIPARLSPSALLFRYVLDAPAGNAGACDDMCIFTQVFHSTDESFCSRESAKMQFPGRFVRAGRFIPNFRFLHILYFLQSPHTGR
jgi:hypothetical protein